MNCTNHEFQKTVHAKYPAKWLSDHYDQAPPYTKTTFVLDTNGECQLSAIERSRLASHIWQDGKVIKDTDGLFTNPAAPVYLYPNGGVSTIPPSASYSTGNGTYTLPSTYTYKVVGNVFFTGTEIAATPVYTKCVCGAHKVDSNNHSSWCEIK